MSRRWSLTQQCVIGTSLLLLGCLLMGIGIIYPALRHMQMLGHDIHQIQGELEQEYTKTQAMRRTIRELNAVTAELETYRAFALPVRDELTIITELESLASAHDLTETLGARFEPTANTPVGLPYYTFSLSLTGSFEHIFEYLHTLETRSYYVSIDTLGISSNTDTTVTLTFDMRIYVQHS